MFLGLRLSSFSFLHARLWQAALSGEQVLAPRIQLTRATAALPLILCEVGYKSPVQIANPQSREISKECQKLKQMRAKWILIYYITSYTKNLNRHTTHLPEKYPGALRDDCAGDHNRSPLLSITLQLWYSVKAIQISYSWDEWSVRHVLFSQPKQLNLVPRSSRLTVH